MFFDSLFSFEGVILLRRRLFMFSNILQRIFFEYQVMAPKLFDIDNRTS